MSAHLSRLRLLQRHLRSLVWVWVWVWDWIHSHTSLRTRSPSSRHPPFTQYPFPPRSLICGGQTSPHKPRLVVSHSTCPPLSSSPHAHSFVLGTAVINNNPSVSLLTEAGRQLFLRHSDDRSPWAAGGPARPGRAPGTLLTSPDTHLPHNLRRVSPRSLDSLVAGFPNERNFGPGKTGAPFPVLKYRGPLRVPVRDSLTVT